jgi:hypothetical protein
MLVEFLGNLALGRSLVSTHDKGGSKLTPDAPEERYLSTSPTVTTNSASISLIQPVGQRPAPALG